MRGKTDTSVFKCCALRSQMESVAVCKQLLYPTHKQVREQGIERVERDRQQQDRTSAGSTQPHWLVLGVTKQKKLRPGDLADLLGDLGTNLARTMLLEEGSGALWGAHSIAAPCRTRTGPWGCPGAPPAAGDWGHWCFP